jgi:photosystem II stability/assembly factor-like uncharacterized protein
MKRSAWLALLLTVILSSPALAAQWQPVGPYGHDGYRLFPTKSPKILYVSTFSTGLYRSNDAGQSWRAVSPFYFGALSVDPRNPDVMFGAPGSFEKVARSVDGGRTFQTEADGFLYRDSNPEIYSFLRDPTDPDVVFAATNLGLFRFDGVSHWDLIAFPGLAVTGFAIDPLSPAIWHAATTDSALQGPADVLISTDAGATWNHAPGDIARDEVGPIFFDPVRPHRAYALANCRPSVFTGGAWRTLPIEAPFFGCATAMTDMGRWITVFLDRSDREHMATSDDGGATWSTHNPPRDIYLRLAAAAGGDGDDEVVIASGSRGLWRSTDGGLTWRAASQGISGFVVGDLAVAADGTVFASPGGDGVFRSRDAGSSWERQVSGLHADALGTPVLAVDPRDPATVWAGGTELHRTRDGGQSWQGLALPREGTAKDRVIDQILVDATRPGVVYVHTYATVAPNQSGVFTYRTLDDGRTWQRLPRVNGIARLLALAPSDGRLYALSNDALFSSLDAGSTWRQVRRSLPLFVTTLAVDPGRSDVLWLGTYTGEVLRSTDGGRNLVNLPGGFISIGSLVFDPADPAHPYMSDAADGVFHWQHNGWQKVGADNPFFEATVNHPLAFDAKNGILYAGTSGRGIYRLRLR